MNLNLFSFLNCSWLRRMVSISMKRPVWCPPSFSPLGTERTWWWCALNLVREGKNKRRSKRKERIFNSGIIPVFLSHRWVFSTLESCARKPHIYQRDGWSVGLGCPSVGIRSDFSGYNWGYCRDGKHERSGRPSHIYASSTANARWHARGGFIRSRGVCIQ